MWLRRSTDPAARSAGWRPATLLVALGLLAGCAAAPEVAGRASTDGSADVEGAVEVSPQAQALFDQATAVLAAGDLLEAEFRFEEFVLQYPGFPGAHVNLAIIHASNGDEQAAEDSITDALLIDPGYAPALNQLGMLLRRQGKFADAEAAYLRAVAADPNYSLAHYNLGVLYELYLRRLQPALAHFQQFQDLDGSDERVGKWIVDLERRLEAEQRSANVTE